MLPSQPWAIRTAISLQRRVENSSHWRDRHVPEAYGLSTQTIQGQASEQNAPCNLPLLFAWQMNAPAFEMQWRRSIVDTIHHGLLAPLTMSWRLCIDDCPESGQIGQLKFYQTWPLLDPSRVRKRRVYLDRLGKSVLWLSVCSVSQSTPTASIWVVLAFLEAYRR